MRMSRAQRKATFASGLLHQAFQSGNPLTLQLGIHRLQRAIDAFPAGDPARAPFLDVLTEAMQAKWQLTGSLFELDAVVNYRRQAAEVIPGDGPEQGALQHNLANVLRIRFERTQVPADIEGAVKAARRAVDLMPEDDPRWPQSLSMLCLALWLRFGVTGQVSDLDEAVRYGQQAADTVTSDDAGRCGIMTNLANGLLRRYERLGSLADLDRAVAASKQAVDGVSADDPERAAMLIALSNALRFRAELTGSLPDLDDAVDSGQQAVDADAARGHPRGLPFSTLALALLRRFERTGAPKDLDAAVSIGWRAVDTTPAEDPTRAMYLSNISGTLVRRFELTGAHADLGAAVDASQRAVDASAGPLRPRFLGNLANTLEARHARTKEQGDIDKAVDASRQAVALAAPDDANRSSYLNSLANALRLRFEQTGSMPDLDEAISFGRQAMSVSPAGSPSQAIMLGSLSGALLVRSSQTGALADLDEAVASCRQAVNAAPPENPFRAAYLNILLATLRARFRQTADPANMHDALDAGRQAVALRTAPTSMRVQAALGWGQLAAETEDWADAVRAYEAGAALLPLIAPRSLSRSDQEFQLSQVAGFGPRAAACCLEFGHAERAVELLEQGRGILLAQRFEPRDLAALTLQYPELAAQFAALRNNLDGIQEALPVPAHGGPAEQGEAQAAAGRSEIDRRRELADTFDSLVAEIRELPGFSRFLLPLPSADFIKAAGPGPVVLVNVSDIRSDALLVTSAGIRPVPLPDLTPEAVHDRVVEFITALAQLADVSVTPDEAAGAEGQLGAVLGWLWDTVAGPVLDALGIVEPSGDDGRWQRIWWCPDGLLSLLPLHAAGDHGTCFDAAPMTVIDRVISAYTPTVRALLHARRTAAGAPETTKRLLLVAMPHTEGAADLPGAPKETASLQAMFGPDILILNGNADPGGPAPATYAAVERAMPAYPWAHFACHAANRLDNPSAGFLLLRDYADRPLTVLSIERLNLEHAELAFLSACSTAQTGLQLPDETINLASAFQLAGYRRVVATLWPVDDRLAVRLAHNFYRTLSSAPATDAAYALHRATRRLRRTHAGQPSAWAAHIYHGS